MIGSRIDPVTWAIHVDAEMPAAPMDHLWGRPSDAAVMRPVLHESVHFWHGISTQYGMRLAFDCLKSFNSLRFAARNGTDLASMGPDWDLDGCRPFAAWDEMQRRHEAPGEGLPITAAQLFEGLARYWDLVICSGFTTSHLVAALIRKESETYSAAYVAASDEVGEVAFILFPVFGYLALCTPDPVGSFRAYLSNYRRDPFPVPGGSFQVAWRAAWSACSAWPGLQPRPFSPMTSYKRLHRSYVGWKMRYAGLVPEDAPMAGHPILEEYVQGLMALARERWPQMTDHDREAMMFPEFALPGNPVARQVLVQRFFPPMVQFRGGQRWVNRAHPLSVGREEHFGTSMERFAVLSGGAFGLLAQAGGVPLRHACPHDACGLHAKGLCSYVLSHPDSAAACSYPALFRAEFGVDGRGPSGP
jgi:hypothetical protein